jgi:hypothetical protein
MDELHREIRQLAHVMVRFEEWERDARERNRWYRVGQYSKQRELTQHRRSALLREVWEIERSER